MRPEEIIVVPCYNEAGRLDAVAFRAFAERDRIAHFLFVDDGSRDETPEVLARLSEECEAAHVLSLRENRGKAEAVRAGVLAALERKPARIGYWDADLATPLEALPAFRRELAVHPRVRIVLGSRVRLLGRTIQRRAMRHYLGRVFATFASIVTRLPVYDTQCGAKLMRADEEIRALFEAPFRTRWSFDVELLARFERARAACGDGRPEDALRELPLEVWRDVPGSKLRPIDFALAAGELLRIARAYPPVRARTREPHARDGAG